MNERAPEQWRIISEHVDIRGKSVIDLGCGHCDLLRLARKDGAELCVGVDKDGHPESFNLTQADLETFVVESRQVFDVALCFSVLPYLENPSTLLEWMCKHARVSFVECQYSGDGPGFEHIRDDDDMREWLERIGWSSVQAVGRTEVEGRGFRTIWMCAASPRRCILRSSGTLTRDFMNPVEVWYDGEPEI